MWIYDWLPGFINPATVIYVRGNNDKWVQNVSMGSKISALISHDINLTETINNRKYSSFIEAFIT